MWIFQYLPVEELRLENNYLIFDIFQVRLTKPHSVDKRKGKCYVRQWFILESNKIHFTNSSSLRHLKIIEICVMPKSTYEMHEDLLYCLTLGDPPCHS